MTAERQTHPFAPVWDGECRVLVLGTFPSVRSRTEGFYYGHPQNRFWRVLAALLDEPLPQTVPEKRAMLLKRHIALWDVLSACDIALSSDSSIRREEPNDLAALAARFPLRAVIANGQTAGRLFQKHFPDWETPLYILPSTSPANAARTLPMLTQAWKPITLYL